MSKLSKKLVKSIAKDLEKFVLLSGDDLSNVAGGTTLNVIPLRLWEEGIEAEGCTLSTKIEYDNERGSYKYTWDDNSGVHYSCTVPLVKIRGEWYVKVE